MALLTYPKDSNERLSTHFMLREFDCPCQVCVETILDSALISKLEALRAQTGPLRINSGYRCSNYQTELRLRGYETATGVSQHTEGRAADVMSEDSRFSGVALESFARTAGFMAVGVGGTWVHVDLRDDKERRWEYTKR